MNSHAIELEERIETRLKSLDIIIRLGWALIIGAFSLGIWVATIQISLNQHAQQLQEVSHQRTAEMASIRALELKDSADTQLLKHIIEKLERIEQKLNH